VRRKVNDVARIFSITVTNAVDGVSSSCQACALSSQPSGSACVPCPPGHYIDSLTSKCLECPHNSYLEPHGTQGSEACKACGPASRSDKVCRRCGFMGQAVSHFRLLERKTHHKTVFLLSRTTDCVTVTATLPTQRAMSR
ncbi:Endosome/lysosome-associated apoptosis and autophagy regulator member 2, partial [Xenoophorus captivus]